MQAVHPPAEDPASRRPVRGGQTEIDPLAHSHVLDTCVDRAILPFLEGFNQNVAPTLSSRQGVDMLSGRRPASHIHIQ